MGCKTLKISSSNGGASIFPLPLHLLPQQETTQVTLPPTSFFWSSLWFPGYITWEKLIRDLTLNKFLIVGFKPVWRGLILLAVTNWYWDRTTLKFTFWGKTITTAPISVTSILGSFLFVHVCLWSALGVANRGVCVPWAPVEQPMWIIPVAVLGSCMIRKSPLLCSLFKQEKLFNPSDDVWKHRVLMGGGI